MNLGFLFGACALVLLALCFLLWPLLAKTRAQSPQAALAVGLCVGLPLLAVVLYGLIGTPAALDARKSTPQELPAMSMDDAVAKLRTHLQQQPDDARGWALLGNAYRTMQRPAAASSAFERALALVPANPDLLVAAVEAASMARADHRIDVTGRERLQRALEASPRHQRALWLLGISQFQADQYAAASRTWERLLVLLDPTTQQSVIASVRQQIANAADRAGKSAEQSSGAATSPSRSRIQVHVALAPELVGKVPDGASLFVFARAVDGPSVPLAVARLPAVLPVDVVLDDSKAMTPSARLSAHRNVIVQARISASGNALPQPGDLESTPVPVALGNAEIDVGLVIDHALEGNVAGPG